MAAHDVRQYTDDDWAVRRWDAFNGGVLVRPKSFCQFWRTVLLWATLNAIPFIGQLFIPPTARPPRPERPMPERRPWNLTESRTARQAGTVAKWAALPVWLPLVLLWAAIGVIAEYIDDRPQLARALAAVIVVAAVCAVLFGLGMIAFLVVTDLVPWLLSLDGLVWWIAAGAIVAAPFAAVVLYVGLVLLWAGMKAAASIMALIWGVAVTNKKRVCPPIEIVRA